MDLLKALENHALAVSALTAALGVIAALFSALAAWVSARQARDIHQATEEAERLRLVSQISDLRSELLSESQFGRLFAVEHQIKLQLAFLAKHVDIREKLEQDINRLSGGLDRARTEFDGFTKKYEPLVLSDESDKELESQSRARLEGLLREHRKALDQTRGRLRELEQQVRMLDERLRVEMPVAD